MDVTGQLKFLIAAVFALTVTFAPALPAAASTPGNTAFERTWNRTDQPVSRQLVNRTWMWGPQPFTGAMMEWVAERPDAGREVQYFDKSRMEVSLDPTISPYSIWHVTNGLLARELVTGQMQLGDTTFEERGPAQVNVAGDWDDPTGPTYATFGGLLGEPALDEGSPVTSRLTRDGAVTSDPDLEVRGVAAAALVPETGHSVASPFWNFMNSSGTVQESGPPRTGQLFANPFYATGYPITEAYWTNVKVADTYTEVLVQVFERRVLTYTPGNPDGWQVEAGNVGRHYFEWRYGMSPPDGTVIDQGGVAPLGPSPMGRAHASSGAATLVVANGDSLPVTIRVAGSESMEVTLDGCPDCDPLSQPAASCDERAPSRSVALAPGSYAVTLSRPGPVQPLGGIWTLLPDTRYGACFFTFQ